MKKIIVARVKGDLESLFNRWEIPDGIYYDKKTSEHALLRFEGENVDLFDGLERAASALGDKITVHPRFSAHSFDNKDCLDASLVAFYLRCQRGVDLKHLSHSVRDLQKKDTIELSSSKRLHGKIFLTCSNLYFFSNELLETLKTKGLVDGLFTLPASLEIGGKKEDNDWVWVSSRVDLGRPYLDRRFLQGFCSGNWGGEDFCTSSFYDCEPLFISQPVYRIISSLPDARRLEFNFEPVELLDCSGLTE